MVMNEHYGSRAELPFDLQSKAGPIMFTLPPDADRQRIIATSRHLTARLAEALEPFITQHIENIRRSKPFPEAKAKDGQARFRAPGEPIGILWDLAPFGSTFGNEINLATGAASWLRLMPTFDPSKTWTAQELRDAARAGGVLLQPFIWSSLFTLRAADGIGYCNLLTSQEREMNSVVFAFETGEVWAWVLGTDPSKLFVGEIERGWTERLKLYASFLGHLGLHAPYRWIAGVAGVKRRHLQYAAAPGQTFWPGRQGPECLVEEITVEGSYDGEQSPISALLPFFDKLYNRCGISRPEYLQK
jgi:hypothetical protein